jgi:hypothetical protein
VSGQDPRIIWLRGVVADQELPRTARLVGTLFGAQLTSDGRLSIGMAQLVQQTGYSYDVVKRSLRALRAAGWLSIERRGFRGRTSTYRADSPALMHRSEVTVTGTEYRAWVPLSSPKYRAPVPPIQHEMGAPVPLTSPEYGAPTPPDPRLEGTHAPPLVRTQELRTYVGDSDPDQRRRAAQAPTLAVAEDPAAAAVIAHLPGHLQPRGSASRRRFLDLIGQRLAAGWTVEQLVSAGADVGPAEVRDAPAFWASLVPTTPPPAPARLWRPAWCGECDEHTRQLDLDDGTVARCPACHPLVAAAAVTS